MQTPSVRATTPADEAAAIDTIVLAFATDPIARWCWPNPRQYLTSMPSFTRALGGGAFLHNGAHCADDDAGAALGLPPQVHPEGEVIGEVLERTVSASIRGDLFAVFEQMATYDPSEPHCYLPLIGVDPARQGNGCGAALLTYALQQCDRNHSTAYLEASSPRNVPLYLRHGFEVLGAIQVGASPPIVPLVRQPR